MRLLFTSLIVLCCAPFIAAQSIYFFTYGPPNPGGFWRINLATCEICPAYSPDIATLGGNTNDVLRGAALLANGDFITLRGVGAVNDPPGGFLRFDPPNPVRTFTQYGPVTYQGVCTAPNGTIYLSTETTLYTFNPTNNTVTSVGNYPSGLNVIYIFFQGGQMYGLGNYNSGAATIIQINPANPATATAVGTTYGGFFHPVTASNGFTYGYVGLPGAPPYGFYRITVPDGILTPVCVPPVPPPFIFAMGSVNAITAAPPGGAELPCLCLAVADDPINTQINVCVPNPVSVDFSGNGQPDFNDIVRYILYTNPANPMGSIIQQNTSPNFTYQPPLQPNVPYYVAQVIGNALNGNVNPNDPCITFSDAATVTWRPRPTLAALTAAGGDLCAGDCTTVSVTFNGTPPFAYSWQVQQGGTVLTPLQVVFNINTNPSTFQACVPPGAPPGPANVVVCGILDNYCGNP